MVEIVSHDSTEMVSLGLAALVLSRAKKVGPIMNAAFELVNEMEVVTHSHSLHYFLRL